LKALLFLLRHSQIAETVEELSRLFSILHSKIFGEKLEIILGRVGVVHEDRFC
jgi:hypothetical protein